MANKKPTQSEIDGVQYRRAKLWQIMCYACNSLVGMSVYSLIGMASYAASIGFGITTAVVGVILTGTRIFDGITDPLLAFVYDKVNTPFGKLRPLLIVGWGVQSIGLLLMFKFGAGKVAGAAGILLFTLFYVIYVIGYTITNMTAQTIPALLTNDPRQRPTVGVWTTAFNYAVPMVLSIVFNVVMLPKFGGTYNLEFLSAACLVVLAISFLGTILVCLGVTPIDKPESFAGLTKKREPLKFKDMVDVIKGNKALQCYIVANASDKLAQQTASQAIINTLLFGILIGNMGLSTILTMIGMLPSILFAIFGAKYAGKHGSKEAMVTWTKVCLVVAAVMVLFFIVINPADIAKMMSPMMIGYTVLNLVLNGCMMCVTTASTSFMADVIDVELDRSGRYVPAVVTGTYSLIDKLISSLGATIAAGAVALIGYTTTMPQPGDPATPAVFWLAIGIKYILPMLGWVCTLIAMSRCKMDKAEMVSVQKRIAEKKAALVAEKG
ncbi:MAG: MFS transporter [Gemmiger sp.]|nr:MFS transporter [Gemmiger sp.]